MKKVITGFFAGCIISCFIFVYIIENIHIIIEKRADISWCIHIDEAIYEKFGEPAREIFYIMYKIFQYPYKSFYVYTNSENRIKFYPKPKENK